METIKEKIKKKGVTMEHISKMIGVDRAYLSRIVNGKHKTLRDSIELRILKYLDAINTDDENLLK